MEMGLYFKGKESTEKEMLKKHLDITEEELLLPYKQRPYICKPLEPSERLWIWIHKKTGKAVITGDEGNGWCVVLIIANSEDEAIQQYIKSSPKTCFKDFLDVLEQMLNITYDNTELP